MPISFADTRRVLHVVKLRIGTPRARPTFGCCVRVCLQRGPRLGLTRMFSQPNNFLMSCAREGNYCLAVGGNVPRIRYLDAPVAEG
ncbi:hypothetical protein EVAR_19737_1 [Eumeta japonica]|uniref:Uncharacterized protein n=1 Tax=Eumeta variegata TaxID=151549 RepID=A0A4C1URU7_EUMVA|nr:hypothetical protein EVAR_19737_1 [Eumeta japonica]